MINLKDLENVDAVELDLEELREINGGRYGAAIGTGSGEKDNSTVTDYIYEAAWRYWWY
jgi:hypothetical protein